MRSGQACAVYKRGNNMFHRCRWTGAWRRARIVRRYKRGRFLSCALWKLGRASKSVCWNIRTKIVKRYKRGANTCTIYRRGARSWERCRFVRTYKRTNLRWFRWGRWGRMWFRRARVARRFSRQGQQCVEYVRGSQRFIKCGWGGTWRSARLVKRFRRRGLSCQLWMNGRARRTVCWNFR